MNQTCNVYTNKQNIIIETIEEESKESKFSTVEKPVKD